MKRRKPRSLEELDALLKEKTAPHQAADPSEPPPPAISEPVVVIRNQGRVMPLAPSSKPDKHKGDDGSAHGLRFPLTGGRASKQKPPPEPPPPDDEAAPPTAQPRLPYGARQRVRYAPTIPSAYAEPVRAPVEAPPETPVPVTAPEPAETLAPAPAERPVVVEPLVPDREEETPPVRPAPRTHAVRRPPAALLVANLVAAAFYVTWWRNAGTAGQPVLFWLLAAAEAFSLVHLLGYWWAAWNTKFEEAPPLRSSFQVDVLIPTRGEPLDVLRRTITAAVAMEGSHRTFVCDDAARPEVETLARSLGAGYLARLGRTGAKAGNLNAALQATAPRDEQQPRTKRRKGRKRKRSAESSRSRMGQLVVVFDADHAPRKDFLQRTMGYFEDPSVAFVQTPQYYGNADANEIAHGAYQQQTIFYGPICRGREGLNAAFCCGTNVVFRRRALEQAGGFDEDSIVEDFVTSMRVHRRGWRSVFYPYVLAEGMGPEDTRSYFRQQFRWARGSIGALTSLEPFRRGFTLPQRLNYLLSTTFYLIGLVTAIYVALPIMYFLFGMSPFSPKASTFVFFYTPYMVLALITLRWGVGGRLTLRHLQYTFGSFMVYGLAAISAMLGLPARFRVTSKARADRPRPHVLALATVVAFAALVASLVYGLATAPFDARTATNAAWTVVDLLLLWGIVRVTLRETRTWLFGTRAGYAPSIRPLRLEDEPESLVLPERALGPQMPAKEETFAIPGTAMRLRPAAVVAWLTAAGLTVRLSLMMMPSLRMDESLIIQQTGFTWTRLYKHMLLDNVHIPGYHAFMKVWLGVVGESIWALRLPSVLAGAAAIPLVYLVGRRLVGPRAAVFAAAMGAVLPMWVWHSTEARMYPFMLVATLGGVALLYRALERDGAWHWVSYAAVVGIGSYLHYYMLLMPLVHLAILFVLKPSRTLVRHSMLALGGAAVLFMPWGIDIIQERFLAQGIQSFDNAVRTAQTAQGFEGSFFALLIFFLVFVTGYQAAAPLSGMWPLVALGAVVIRTLAHLSRNTARILSAWIVLTVGVIFAASAFKSGIFLQRYLIAASPPLLLIGGAALARVSRRGFVALTLVIAALVSLTAVQYTGTQNPLQERYREGAEFIQENKRPGDVIVALPGFIRHALRFYVDQPVVGVNLDAGFEDSIKQVSIFHSRAEGAGMWLLTSSATTAESPEAAAIEQFATFGREQTHELILGTELTLRRFAIDSRQ